MTMRFGYNTNGFAHHRLEDALAILAELGYQSVAITLDHHHLNPFDAGIDARLAEVRGLLIDARLAEIRRLLETLSLGCVIETGARFLLDPWNKHQPTLLSENSNDRQRRLDFLLRAVEIARKLRAQAVSFWSGMP